VNSPDEIVRVFREGKISLVVFFGDHFYEKLMHTGNAQVQLVADATDPNNATTLINYASAIIGYYQQDLTSQMKMPFQISIETKFLYNPQMKGAFNFVPGVLGMILMLICAMMTSIAIVREKETGTMEVLLVSPLKPIFIILAKAVPYFLLSCVNLATVLLLSVYVLGVPVAGSLFWLILVSLIFIFVSLALGLLVSTMTDTQVAAMLLSGMAFMMPVMLLSGMMFPIEDMPAVLQWISNIIPAKWFIITVKNLMIKGAGVSSVIPEILILVSMAVVIITLSLIKFKSKLE
jgi:ABC-2 type transport system permease protein